MKNRADPEEAVYLGLGSNLGDRRALLQEALVRLWIREVRPHRVSSLYDTEPIGSVPQGNFLNLVVQVGWDGGPRDLLAVCLEVEERLGRTRSLAGGPRTLDIDILLFGDRTCREPGLELPHPRMHLRRFVLEPLSEIAPQAVHPILKRSVVELLAECPDRSGVRPLPDRLSLERVSTPGYNPAASRGNQ